MNWRGKYASFNLLAINVSLENCCHDKMWQANVIASRLLPARYLGLASTCFHVTLAGRRSDSNLPLRLRDFRYFINYCALPVCGLELAMRLPTRTQPSVHAADLPWLFLKRPPTYLGIHAYFILNNNRKGNYSNLLRSVASLCFFTSTSKISSKSVEFKESYNILKICFFQKSKIHMSSIKKFLELREINVTWFIYMPNTNFSIFLLNRRSLTPCSSLRGTRHAKKSILIKF